MINHTSRPKTVADLQVELARALAAVLELDAKGALPPELGSLRRLAPPPGFAAEVSLRHRENDRQIKSTASASGWNAQTCAAWIEYVPDPDATSAGDQDDAKDEIVCSLIRLLDEVERQPRKFTSWTWFRDQHLPKQGWNQSKEQIQQVIVRATVSGVLKTSKVKNPKQPDYPVTSIELDREHPLVRRVLNQTGVASRFEPVSLPGVPLSETVREDRR